MEKKLVLIVDDKSDNRLLLRKILASKDYAIQEAVNGLEGLKIARLHKPDFIISDVLMPVMDGFLFCKEVKKDETLKNIPFVFYTATYVNKEDEEFGLSLGAEKYLVKPLEPDALLDMLEHIMEQYKNGHFATPRKVIGSEKEIFKRYSERLVNKLEQKMLDLEKENIKCKQTEKALRESELKFRLLADYTLDWEYWVDLDGKFIYVSPSCKRITGYSPEELMSDPQLVFKMVRPDYAEKIHNHYFDEKSEDVPVFSIEFAIIAKNGEEVWLEHNCSPIYDDHGKYAGRRGNNRDITDRKQVEEEKSQLEEQYRQAQKMESVGRLAGGVAHDYNNALSVIMGYTEMAMIDADPTGPLHANLNEVFKAARHATDITRQLLAFARKQTIEPKVLDLNENVESMFKMLQRLIGEDIDLVWLPVTNLWPVKMDPSQIDQILANLCVNARDAIAGVGKITVETDMVALDETYCADHVGFIPGEFVMLAVSDNGCGMDKEMLDNIFEPFFTTKDVDKGTGLGLATVYGIVKQNNGFINVYSEPGKGTTIKIHLPRHEAKSVEIQEEISGTIPQGRGETILVVEDDLPILKLVQKVLQGLNYIVLIADTPKEAIGLAQEHTNKIHLIITDVIMPEMNGRELSEHLQSLSPDLKCIFMSGYTANAIAHHGVLDEGVHFIQKPFSKNDLATIVRKVLDRGKS